MPNVVKRRLLKNEKADTISDETERAFDEAIQHMQFLKKTISD